MVEAIENLPQGLQWRRLGQGTYWRTWKDMDTHMVLRAMGKALMDIGFDVNVETYISEDGRLRAICHYCGSMDCIHAYFGIQDAIRTLILNYLEGEYGDFIEASKKIRNLSRDEKRAILISLQIDIDDLEEYLEHLIERNKEALSIWKYPQFYP